LSGVRDVAASAAGVYVLRTVPYPGDTSGAGWQVDLLSTRTWQIMRSAAGDAAPYGLALGFGSVWVLTGPGAKPGGLGSGVNRLDASTLEGQARVVIPSDAGVSIGVSDTSVWLLGPTELDRIDPVTDAITRAKAFPNLFAEGLATVSHEVLVGSLTYPAFETSGPVVVSITTFRDTDVKALSRQVVARFPSGAGDPPALDLAAETSREVYVGFASVRLGESLAVSDDGRVFGPDRVAGGVVAVSDTGIAWAAKLIPPVAARMTSIQRIGALGSTIRTVATVPGPAESISAFGPLLYVADPAGLEVLR
jgi:hypothetical protein